jgi:acyl carrier protein
MSDDREAVYFEIIRILKEECGVKCNEISLNARFQEDLGLDSVGLLTLALEAENSFQLMLEEPPESPPKTVIHLVELVCKRLSENLNG